MLQDFCGDSSVPDCGIYSGPVEEQEHRDHKKMRQREYLANIGKAVSAISVISGAFILILSWTGGIRSDDLGTIEMVGYWLLLSPPTIWLARWLASLPSGHKTGMT